MKKSVLLSVILFIIISCKVNQKVLDIPTETTGFGGMTVPTERNLTSSELEIGRRICSNLKKKRELFEKLDNNKEQFRFKAELKNCDGSLYNSEFFVATLSLTNSTEPEYIAAREKYFKDVVTDQSGALKPFCELMAASDQVSNSLTNNNFQYRVAFLISNGFDRYEITKTKKSSTGSSELLFSEAVSLFSLNTQVPAKFFGVEKDRIRYSVCEGKKYSSVSQVWVEALTDFVVK